MTNHEYSAAASERMIGWWVATGFALAVFMLCAPMGVAQAAAQQPTLNLFPSQAIDSIKETGEHAKQLEDNLQTVLSKLEQQMKLYKQSKCKGAIRDEGCQQLSSEMAKSYAQMLDTMAKELPKMERSIVLTRDTLQKRLAEQLGYGSTAAQLQQLLRKNRPPPVSQRTRPRSQGLRLSDRFRQYYRLVSQGTGDTPMALVGARIYLDLEETSKLINLTEQQIQRGQLIANLSESFGTITPQMQSTVSDVKQVMFGEDALGGGDADTAPTDIRNSPDSSGSKRFCSEFDRNC